MTDHVRTLPAGSDVRLSAPSLPPHPPLLDRLRMYVRQHHRVGAVYVFGMQHGDEPPWDVVAATLPGGELADHAVEIDDLQLAVVDVLPSGATVDLTVLGPRAELDVLAAFAPVGAGGRVETACARALAGLQRPGALANALASATLFVPALADGESEPDTRPPAAPASRPARRGVPTRWPVTRHGGHDVVSVFSSWPALLHADPPFPQQLAVPGHALLGALPPGIGLAVDPGCLHAVAVPASDVAILRDHLDHDA